MYAEAIRSQGRVILALMLREARTRYGRTKLGYLWAFIQPCVHIAFFWSLMTFFGGRANPLDDNNAMFLATGMLTFLGFRNVMKRTQGGYGSNEALLSFPIVKVVDVFLGRALLELVTWASVTLVIIAVLIAAGAGVYPHNSLAMVAALLALFFIAFGMGMTIGLLSEFIPALGNILSIPMRLLYFVSGVFFLPDALPPHVREILAWNPVLHGITLFREGYYWMYDSNILDMDYLFGWAIGCVLVAFMVERASRRSIRNLP
jgi:capsular polysaccharide transport system permease protein